MRTDSESSDLVRESSGSFGNRRLASRKNFLRSSDRPAVVVALVKHQSKCQIVQPPISSGGVAGLTWCFFSCQFFIRSRSFLYHCLSPQNWCSCGTPPPEAVVHLGPHCSSTLPYHALLRGTFFGKKCPENGILINCRADRKQMTTLEV